MRTSLVIANWKMNGSRPGNAALLAHIRRGLEDGGAGIVTGGGKALEVVICPPFVYLGDVALLLEGGQLQLGAQDLSAREPGAHTGEVAGEMLRELGCRYVLVGHSERRQDLGESDGLVAQKYQRALAAGLQPVLCVGETQAEREAGRTTEVVTRQLDAVFSTPPRIPVIVAYEPVWAIGTGKTASVDQVQEVHSLIRQRLGAVAGESRILYGGSVKAGNAAELFHQPDVDGGLIGGASLEADAFVAICRAAK